MPFTARCPKPKLCPNSCAKMSGKYSKWLVHFREFSIVIRPLYVTVMPADGLRKRSISSSPFSHGCVVIEATGVSAVLSTQVALPRQVETGDTEPSSSMKSVAAQGWRWVSRVNTTLLLAHSRPVIAAGSPSVASGSLEPWPVRYTSGTDRFLRQDRTVLTRIRRNHGLTGLFGETSGYRARRRETPPARALRPWRGCLSSAPRCRRARPYTGRPGVGKRPGRHSGSVLRLRSRSFSPLTPRFAQGPLTDNMRPEGKSFPV